MSKIIPLINNAIDTTLKFSYNNRNIEDFESDFERFLGRGHSFTALNSGTSSIHLALLLLGVKSGDEVICQTFTFAASAFPVLYLKARPVFIDSERKTWNMCPDSLREAIMHRLKKGKKPKAIIVVHTYGMPAKMDEILKVSKEFNIPIIEDAAGALGSIYKEQKCGTIGDFGVFSFNNNKIITTFGGGGLVTKNKTLKKKSIFLATQAKEDCSHYKHNEIGYNYRMSPVAASLGLSELSLLGKKILHKKNIFSYYDHLFECIPGVELKKEPNENFESNHWLTSVLINDNEANESNITLRKKLYMEGIETRLLWKPLHLQLVFKNCLYFGNNVAEMLFNSGLSLPSGILEKSDLDRISSSINKIL